MILSTCSQNVNDASPDGGTLTSSYLHWILPTILPSTLLKSNPPPSSLSNMFKSDSPLFDHKKINEKLVVDFIW